jgi:hypothetical protein
VRVRVRVRVRVSWLTRGARHGCVLPGKMSHYMQAMLAAESVLALVCLCPCHRVASRHWHPSSIIHRTLSLAGSAAFASWIIVVWGAGAAEGAQSRARGKRVTRRESTRGRGIERLWLEHPGMHSCSCMACSLCRSLDCCGYRCGVRVQSRTYPFSPHLPFILPLCFPLRLRAPSFAVGLSLHTTLLLSFFPAHLISSPHIASIPSLTPGRSAGERLRAARVRGSRACFA